MYPRIAAIVLSLLFSAPSIATATELGPPASSATAPPSAVRYRRPPPQVNARQSLATRLKEARQRIEAQRASDRPSDLAPIARPGSETDREATRMEITDAKIAKLRELLRVTAIDSPEYPDLLMRLADLHLERKAYFERQAGALAQPIWEAEHGIKPADSDKSPVVPSPTTTPRTQQEQGATPAKPRTRRRARDR